MEINQILLRALAQGRSVTLPGAGSLVVRYAPARQNGAEVSPPLRTVAFVADEQGTPLLELLSEASSGGSGGSGASGVGSQAAFDRWLADVVTPDGLHIEGVGDLVGGEFRAAPALESALNPLGQEPLKLRPRRRIFCTVLGLVGLFVVVAAVVFFVAQYLQRPVSEEISEEIPTAVAPAEVSAEVPAVSETTAASVAVETSSSSEVVPAPAPAPSPSADPSVVTPTVSGVSYVVWGVYSTESNARRGMHELQSALARAGVQGAPQVHFYADKWMVSAFESTTAGEAAAFVRAHAAELRADLWRYTKK